MKAGTLITFGIIGIVVLSIVFWAIGVSNTYNQKFQTGKAKQLSCQNNFDNMWKTIQSEAKVADKYKDGFKEVYSEMISARYENDKGAGQQSLMKWIRESNPNFDASLYRTLMNIIEGKRESFKMAQDQLIDIDRELKTMKVTFPQSIVVKNKLDLDIQLVTSAKTEEVYRTGQENDINPFSEETEKPASN